MRIHRIDGISQIRGTHHNLITPGDEANIATARQSPTRPSFELRRATHGTASPDDMARAGQAFEVCGEGSMHRTRVGREAELVTCHRCTSHGDKLGGVCGEAG